METKPVFNMKIEREVGGYIKVSLHSNIIKFLSNETDFKSAVFTRKEDGTFRKETVEIRNIGSEELLKPYYGKVGIFKTNNSQDLLLERDGMINLAVFCIKGIEEGVEFYINSVMTEARIREYKEEVTKFIRSFYVEFFKEIHFEISIEDLEVE